MEDSRIATRLHEDDGEVQVNSLIYAMGQQQARIQDSEGGFVQEFRVENRSYPDVHDFSLRMLIIAND